MRPSEVVFYQPFSHSAVETIHVQVKIPLTDKLFLQCSVESLQDSVVFGSMVSGEVVVNVKVSACFVEVFQKFRAIVCLDVFYLTI